MRELEGQVAICQACPLHKGRNNTVFGIGNQKARLMVVGEAPGAEEDRVGLPFIGKAGDTLTRWLKAVGISRDEVYIANVVKCRPPNNRNPHIKEMDECLPYLKKQIEIIKPKIILALGKIACDALIGRHGDPMYLLRGEVWNYQFNGHILVIPTYHPAYALRNPKIETEVEKDLVLLRDLYKKSKTSGMQIRIGPSKSIIYHCADNLIDPLLKKFTYTNRSISYQLNKHRSSRHNVIQRYRMTKAMNETDAIKMWEDEKRALERQLKPCLLKTTTDGLIVFPTGLLDKISQFFVSNGVALEKSIVDKRVKPKETMGYSIATESASLRPYQEEAVKALLDKGQGTAVAGTGTGKTVVIQELLRRLGLRAVVVVPSLSILSQTEKRFSKYFGRGRIGSFSGKKKKKKDITLACAPSLAKSDPKDWEDVDVLIFDECHHTPCETIEAITYKVIPKAFYRFGFTATYSRTDGADLAIEAAVFPPVHTYTVEKGIEEGFLAKPRFLMFNVGFCSYRRYGGKMPVFAYKNHLIRNEALNKKIIEHANSFVQKGQQVLILVREKLHGHMLQSGIPNSVFVRTKGDESKLRYKAPYVDPDEAVAKFNKKEIRCLIGTSIIGEGTDIVPVDVLFNLMGGTSKVTVMQNIGRALRPAPGKDTVWIIDYIHSTNDMLEKHSFKRYNIYKKIGKVDILELKKDT